MGNKSSTPTKTLLTIKERNIEKFYDLVLHSSLCLGIVDLNFRVKFTNPHYCDLLNVPNPKTIENKSHQELVESQQSIFSFYQPYYKKETLDVIQGVFDEVIHNFTAESMITYQIHQPKIHYLHAKVNIRKLRIGKDFFFLFTLTNFQEKVKLTPRMINNSDHLKTVFNKRSTRKNTNTNTSSNTNKNNINNNNNNKNKNKRKFQKTKIVKMKKKTLILVSSDGVSSSDEKSNCSFIEEI
ncbi:hypothetical protein M0812_28868 [Anaeramoeba flamelloides]|uniref:PAS domain-containing protein n=1 Tax=Anaeramoeba flamelloides TaxID=1746091 RepID=A0AAV7YCW0_9EUKA|nr:hypothetical protein M0812_28868 [Anaeramoeba flamelloides]